MRTRTKRARAHIKLLVRKHFYKPNLLKRHIKQKCLLFKRLMPQVIKEKADQVSMRGVDRLILNYMVLLI